LTQAAGLRPRANGHAKALAARPGAAPRTIKPPRVRNATFHWLGALLLVANKVRHKVRGYKTPRPFPVSETSRVVEYDFNVVDKWLAALRQYSGRHFSFHGRTVLELGPGPDLGTGLLLLSNGAKAYHALDVVDLALRAPPALYDQLLARFDDTDRTSLASELENALHGEGKRLNFVVDPGFDVRTFAGRDVDLVVSQAAFEHFDNPGKVIARLNDVVAPGSILVSEIDLQTHNRWLRDSDPLNIYRYSDRFYEMTRLSGSPNRWRPADYVDAFSRNGWRDISLTPITTLHPDYLPRVVPALNQRFQAPENRLEVLHFVICARKA